MKQAACVLIRNPDNKILVVYRKGDKTQIGFPGGKKERYETLTETALRECEEETGIKVRNARVLYSSVISGEVDFICATYLVDYSEGEIISSVEGEAVWLTEEECLKTQFQLEYMKEVFASEKIYQDMMYGRIPNR